METIVAHPLIVEHHFGQIHSRENSASHGNDSNQESCTQRLNIVALTVALEQLEIVLPDKFTRVGCTLFKSSRDGRPHDMLVIKDAISMLGALLFPPEDRSILG